MDRQLARHRQRDASLNERTRERSLGAESRAEFFFLQPNLRGVGEALAQTAREDFANSAEQRVGVVCQALRNGVLKEVVEARRGSRRCRACNRKAYRGRIEPVKKPAFRPAFPG